MYTLAVGAFVIIGGGDPLVMIGGGGDALGFVTIQRQILWLTDAQALRQRWWIDLM